MAPIVAALGVSLLALGALLLRRLGSPYRTARILRSAPLVTVSEAVAAALGGDRRYLRVHGRVRSDEEFPDEQDRPLVLRRTRLETLADGGWRVLEEDAAAVPFAIEDRAASIDIDIAALGDGLVVLPRESSGTAAEIRDRVPATVPDGTAVRLRIDQVSAVEHAYAAGLTTLVEDRPPLTAGMGRPLIVSTLEIPEAMRVLAAGRRREAIAVRLLLVCGMALLAGAVAVLLVELTAR